MTNFHDLPLPASAPECKNGKPKLSPEAFGFLFEHALKVFGPEKMSGRMAWANMAAAIHNENDRCRAEDDAYDEEFRRPDIVVPSYHCLLKEIAVLREFVPNKAAKQVAPWRSDYNKCLTEEHAAEIRQRELWCRLVLHKYEANEITLGDHGAKGLIAQMPKLAKEIERAVLAARNPKERRKVVMWRVPTPSTRTLRRWIKAYTTETVDP